VTARAVAAVAIVLAAAPATAAPARVRIGACPELNREEVSRLLELELVASADADTLELSIDCQERTVGLAAEDRRTGRRRARFVDLGRTAPEARDRLVALAAAELAAATLAETAPPEAPPPAIADGVVAPPAPLGVVRVVAEAGGARFFSRLANTLEVGLALRYEGWGILEPTLLLAAAEGSITRDGRQASARSLSLSPIVGARRRLRSLASLTLRAATGPRLALGQLHGHAALAGDEAGTFTAPWIGWLAQAGVAAPLGPRFTVELVGRGGYVLSPIGGRVAGARAIAVEGAWIGASLALGARL
jgi:hypothetical protein